jgi:DNA-binding SARP family transcriptional activator
MELRILLLREFGLERAGTRIGVPVGTQRLMAFLALRGPAHRSLVAGTLWPEVPEPQALASLRTGVWRVNRIEPGLVHSESACLAIPPDTSVDCKEQESFTTRLLRERLEDESWIAARLDLLWRGELLPGWYDDWVVFERERLNQLRLHALEYLSTLMARRNELIAALQFALEAVRAEPLRETANARLIEVYLAEGNVCDAVHQYDTFCGLLQRELGLEPSPQLTSLLPVSPAR